MRPLVSIIMVNYNCGKYVDSLFDSLFKQTEKNFEVLIFNNKSDDGSLNRIREACPSATIIDMNGNAGFSVPNNKGISMAQGEYVLCLNFDVILENTFIEEMINAIKTDLRIGSVAGKVLRLVDGNKSDSIDCLGHYMTRSRYAVEKDYSVEFSWDDYQCEKYVFGTSACAALYRREMLFDIAINGEFFDEDFFAYFEDVDIDWRAQLRNWRCIYTPKAVAYHERNGTGLIKHPEIAACLLSNKFFMMVKNDKLIDILTDIIPIVHRTIIDYMCYAKENPKAITLSVKRIISLLPKMLKKRRYIQNNILVKRAYLRSFINV